MIDMVIVGVGFLVVFLTLVVLVNRLQDGFDSVADEINRLDDELEELREEAIEEVYVSGDDWDLKDTGTGESFLKVTPGNTKLTPLACSYLLLEIKDYLNKKEASDKELKKRYK